MPASNTCVKTGTKQVAMTTIPYPDEPGPGQALVRATLSTVLIRYARTSRRIGRRRGV